MPVSITAGGKTQHYFYGANNFRVATYTEEASSITGKKVYVYEEGLKVAKEIRDNGSTVQTRVHLYGMGELIGVMDEDTRAKRLLVQDHQGSVVQVVGGDATTRDETFFADYGDLAKKVNAMDGLNPSEGWTGKEFDEDIGLTYFGVRFYDPLLGIWLSPDPEYEFSDPYSYVGGDPINLVDPLGLESRAYGPGGAFYVVVYLDQAAGMPGRGGGGGGYSGQFALGGISGSSSGYTPVQREAMGFYQRQFVNDPSTYNLNSPGLGEDIQTVTNVMVPNLLPGVPAGAAGSAVAKAAVAKGAAKAATARAAAKAAIARASARAAAEAAKKAGASGVPKALDITSKQFGKKLGQKARELGLNPSSAKDRFRLQSRIERIFKNANEVRTNQWRGLGEGGKEGPALLFRRGNDVVVTTLDGSFVTLLEGGASNARFLSGTVIP